MLLGSLTGSAWAVPTIGQEHRVLLRDADARAAGLNPRLQFKGGKATADATDAQLASLKKRGIAYELVPVRTVNAQADSKGKGAPGSKRPIPATQVPYGIKMIYGNPNLTTANVTGGAGIIVAVLDTGSSAHADFVRADGSNVIIDCIDFSQKKQDQVQGACTDDQGHGTHVTGTIAAAGGRDGLGIYGVAPGASVYSYKVLDKKGMGYADDIARAIMLAADRGAHIISMSFGSDSPSELEADAIRYAISKGALVIAAAGNSGPQEGTIGYPAAFAEAVAVAALNPDEMVSYFSSRGISDGNDAIVSDREVELAAPGLSVLSTGVSGGYELRSGTSMAAPHIAGLAAIMWQGNPAATRAWLVGQARQHDITMAEQVNNAGVGYDVAAGYGLPQLQVHVNSLWRD